MESYRQIHEQLRAAQLAIVNNRLEAEATARAQARAIAEKLESFNTAIAAERQRQQAESDRADYERQREKEETLRANRTTLWVVTGFGAAGLLAMLLAARFQWRAVKRIAEVIDQRPTFSPHEEAVLLPSGTGTESPGPTVVLSNQRLLSAIDRMEKRIVELEHMSAHPFPPAPSDPLDQTKRAMA